MYFCDRQSPWSTIPCVNS